MRLVTVFILASAVILVAARVIVFDYVDYNPKESDLIDYGNLKLTKVKNKNIYNLRGNFSILRPMGNEKLVKFELLNGNGGSLMRHTVPFCVYASNDKMIWQELVKASNLPDNNPCPLPAGDYEIKKYSMDENMLPRSVRNGKYILNLEMTEAGKMILELQAKVTLK